MEYLGPLQGLVTAFVLIIFRKKVSELIQKAFERFPKYEDGVKAMNVSFKVKPSHITIIALMFLFISILGFFEILFG
ncbi:MAG: hypothetical protein GY699_20845 [Desulfobacteraceae bacterium]|nr:hypothetical protein [Desulfobacteraceae bacterium]